MGLTLGWVGASAQPSAATLRQGACIRASLSTGSCPSASPTKQNKAKQNKTKQRKTKQNKTKQTQPNPNTGLSWKIPKGGSDPCSHVQSQERCLWQRSECVNLPTGSVPSSWWVCTDVTWKGDSDPCHLSTTTVTSCLKKEECFQDKSKLIIVFLLLLFLFLQKGQECWYNHLYETSARF